jgi:hypothetical protein
MKMSNSARRQTINTINNSLVPTSWECCGSGEIVRTLYIYDKDGEQICVGELSGDNGQNTFYNPSGKPWVETIKDKSDEWLLRVCHLIAENN